jgi:hypothetical protein
VNPIPGANIPNWANGKPQNEGYLMPYGSMITQVLVLEAPNPLGPTFGKIAAIAFRYTNKKLADNADACGRAPYSWAVCGNVEYASAYLFPGSNPTPPPTGPVVLQVSFLKQHLSVPCSTTSAAGILLMLQFTLCLVCCHVPSCNSVRA